MELGVHEEEGCAEEEDAGDEPVEAEEQEDDCLVPAFAADHVDEIEVGFGGLLAFRLH